MTSYSQLLLLVYGFLCFMRAALGKDLSTGFLKKTGDMTYITNGEQRTHKSEQSQSAGETMVPSFAEPIPNITVAAGRQVTLPCVVDDIGNYKVAWIHTDRHTLLTLHDRVITRNTRYKITHNGYRTWWLHISDVEQRDSGHYMCQINTSPMKSQVGFLDVVVPPKITEEETSSDTEVREGAEVSMKCRASGSPNPHIKWRREDEKDITIGMKRVPSIHGEFLNISKVSRLHMGAYLCIAANGVQPSVSKRIMLNVNFAPMIWIPNQLVGAPIGTDITLDCNLESYPRSVTYWTREGGVMILSNSKYDSILIDTGIYKVQMRLRIRELRPEDFGSYSCVAKNSLGETEGTIKLYEIPRPTSSTLTTGSVLKSIRGQGKLDGSDDMQSEETVVNYILPSSGQNIPEQDNMDDSESKNGCRMTSSLVHSAMFVALSSFITCSRIVL